MSRLERKIWHLVSKTHSRSLKNGWVNICYPECVECKC